MKEKDKSQWELDFESFTRTIISKLNDGATLESLKTKLRSYSHIKRTNIPADNASCFIRTERTLEAFKTPGIPTSVGVSTLLLKSIIQLIIQMALKGTKLQAGGVTESQ